LRSCRATTSPEQIATDDTLPKRWFEEALTDGDTQVDESDATVIAPLGHPPGQGDGPADVVGTQRAGLVGAKHGVPPIGAAGCRRLGCHTSMPPARLESSAHQS
jgi:hypothetical protein